MSTPLTCSVESCIQMLQFPALDHNCGLSADYQAEIHFKLLHVDRLAEYIKIWAGRLVMKQISDLGPTCDRKMSELPPGYCEICESSGPTLSNVEKFQPPKRPNRGGLVCLEWCTVYYIEFNAAVASYRTWPRPGD
jgi:hypothetical protein